MHRKMPDGAAYIDHVRAAEAAGADTGELETQETPPGFDAVLTLFWQLRRTAGGSEAGPKPISCVELAAWQTLYNMTLQPVEVDTILMLDAAAVVAFMEK